MPSITIDTFQQLVAAIRDTLGPDSGIDSDDVEVSDLIELMTTYESDEREWGKYALGDPSRNYTRNLVDEGNGNANLLILVWNPGKGSVIHDHANAHCIMKVLKGRLCETQYEWPETDSTGPLKVKKETIVETESVAYISDKIGLHKVHNPDPNEVAVSLHLYTPPYAAKFGCNLFDSRTGKKTKVSLCDYFSVRGERSAKPAFSKQEPPQQQRSCL